MIGKRQRDEGSAEQAGTNGHVVHPSRRRRIEYTEADAELAAHYNDLADDVRAVRVKAAVALIRKLETAPAAKVEDVLTRLVKGLCSSRKAARSGFSIALTEALRLAADVQKRVGEDTDLSNTAILQLVLSVTDTEGKLKSQVC